MLECVLVPNAVLVEHENLLGRLVAPHELRVKQIDSPDKGLDDFGGIYFLEVFDVNDARSGLAEEVRFLEHHLLCVWQQLCVVSEVVHNGHALRQEEQRVDEREEEVG